MTWATNCITRGFRVQSELNPTSMPVYCTGTFPLQLSSGYATSAAFV